MISSESNLKYCTIGPVRDTLHNGNCFRNYLQCLLGTAAVTALKIVDLNPLACALSAVAALIAASAIKRFEIVVFHPDTKKNNVNNNLRLLWLIGLVANYCAAYKFITTLATPTLAALNLIITITFCKCVKPKYDFVIPKLHVQLNLLLQHQYTFLLGTSLAVALKISNLNPLACALSVAIAGMTTTVIGVFKAERQEAKNRLEFLWSVGNVAFYCVALKFAVNLSTRTLIGLNLSIWAIAFQYLLAWKENATPVQKTSSTKLTPEKID